MPVNLDQNQLLAQCMQEALLSKTPQCCVKINDADVKHQRVQ